VRPARSSERRGCQQPRRSAVPDALRIRAAQERSARFRELARQVVDRFPRSAAAAEALYELAVRAENPERRAYFDRLRADYPVDQYNYAALAMADLYAELTSPSDALTLAREMATALPQNRSWPPRVAVQESMTRAQALVADRQFAAALEVLGKTDP